MTGEIATSAQLLVDAVRRGDEPTPETFPVKDISGTEVCLRAEGDDIRASLHVETILEHPERHTGRMLGYPETLRDFPHTGLSATADLLSEEIDGAFDPDIDLRFVYDDEVPMNPESAVYRATLDIWFDEAGEDIDSLWIRARPTSDEG